MNRQKLKKRYNWRVKALLSIIIAISCAILVLFGTSYLYFEKKYEESNEEIAGMNFKQADEKMKEIFSDVETQINSYLSKDIPYQIYSNLLQTEMEQVRIKVRIVDDFDNLFTENKNLYGLALLQENGNYIFSTCSGKSRSGKFTFNESIQTLLKECEDKYPYITWESGISLFSGSDLNLVMGNNSIIGIKYIGEQDEDERKTFIIASIKESAVKSTYQPVTYNGSEALLVDKDGKILSGECDASVGSLYEPRNGMQTIQYELPYLNWTLYNIIPENLYMKNIKSMRCIAIIFVILSCLIISVASYVWSRKYISPIQQLMDQMELVENENLDIPIPEKMGWEELDILNEEFYVLVQKLKKYIADIHFVEQEKAKEELRVLQYQMNPHFILGSLNSIRWMAMLANNTVVVNALEKLARIITPILRNSDFTWKLREEIQFCNDYVSMLNIRYGNTMDYELHCSEELYEEEFPRIILQPMIENCFMHGSDPLEKREIKVSIFKDQVMKICVRNSGVFMPDEKIEALNKKLEKGQVTQDHIGLTNVRKRISVLYEKSWKIWVESDVEGDFVVNIWF